MVVLVVVCPLIALLGIAIFGSPISLVLPIITDQHGHFVPGAKLFVDGRLVASERPGSGIELWLLRAGTYDVEVRLKGYRPSRAVVTPGELPLIEQSASGLVDGPRHLQVVLRPYVRGMQIER